MKRIKEISIEDYNYVLEEEKIAFFPKKRRQDSKLLHFDGTEISDRNFSETADFLQKNDLLVFNNTRVINARLWFQKPTGKVIEIFILEPSMLDMSMALNTNEPITWNCFVGGAKKWKDEDLHREIEIKGKKIRLSVHKGQRIDNYFRIQFYWDSTDIIFSDILEVAGNIPLPPYINRELQEDDVERYQTVYSRHEGSVAAPTAGLHFTNDLITAVKEKGVVIDEVTLHVGAGTFKPVQSETIGDHDMHAEHFVVTKGLLQNLLSPELNKTIAVGTTSVRTLESLYWIGTKIVNDPTLKFPIPIKQWDPYEEYVKVPSKKEAIQAVLDLLGATSDSFYGSTQLIIAPGYDLKVIDGLFTNFHMPKSTLLLLVAAVVGENWKDVYAYAKSNNYRFLSYGDSSLLFKKKHPQN